MPHFQPRGGWIEIICGSMFSGKTEELIRQIPSEEMLALAKALDTMKGLLIQQKA